MKRSYLKSGAVLIAIGALAIVLLSKLAPGQNEALYWGFGCGLIGAGAANLFRFFYWSRPQNREEYEKRLAAQKVSDHDERNVMLRQKSAQLINIAMLLLLVLVNLVFTFLGAPKWVVLTLWAVVLFQVFGGILAFAYLSKRM